MYNVSLFRSVAMNLPEKQMHPTNEKIVLKKSPSTLAFSWVFSNLFSKSSLLYLDDLSHENFCINSL
jgi:hypothetical protein